MAKDFAELNRLENEAGIQAPEAGTKEQLVNKFVKAWENETARRAVKGGTGLSMALTLAACGSDSGGGFAFAPSTQGPAPTGETIALTPGIDNLDGTAGDDVFDASPILNDALALVDTLGALDVINGGDGTDTLNVVDTNNFVAPAGVDLNSIEIVNVNAAGTVTFDLSTETDVQQMNVTGIGGLNLDAGAATAVAATSTNVGGAAVLIDGGSTVDVTAAGINNGTITVGANSAASGDVVVNATGTSGTSAIGAISVTGGDTVTINQTASNVVNTTTTLGAVTVNGDAATTAVTVNNASSATVSATVAGVTGNTIVIEDNDTNAGVGNDTDADTITSVTISNFTDADIISSALTTLNVTGGGDDAPVSGGIELIADSSVSPATTLALNSAGGAMGAIFGTQANAYTTINVASSADTTIANLTATALETINFTGAGDTTLTVSTLGGATTTDINVTGSGGVTLGSVLADGTDFDGNSGDDSIIVGNTTQGITMGAGNDTVQVDVAAFGAATASVDAGTGAEDTLVMSAANAVTASATATFEADISGFEILTINTAFAGGANATVDLANLDEINAVNFAGAAAGAGAAYTFDNFANNGTLTYTGTMVEAADVVNANVAGAAIGSQTFNVGIESAAAVNTGALTVADVETIVIDAPDATATGGAAVRHTVDLDAAAATSLTVSGNNGFIIDTAGSTAITSFDASGVVGNGDADTAANLAVTFASGNTTATAEVSITGGEGDDNLTGNASIDTISGGAGDDTINGGDNSDVLTGGAGADTFVFGPGSSGGNPTVAGNFDEITDFNTGGSDVISLGLGPNLTIDASSNSAPIGTAAISNEGIATFNAADNLLSEQVIAVEDALGGDIAGEFAVFENENGNSYVFVSDNVAGVGAGDVLIQLTSVTGLSDTTLTGGDLTIA